MKNYLLLFFMTFIGSYASYFLKKASNHVGALGLLKEVTLYIGAILYLFTALINIYILQFLEYSVVLPLTSLTYVWTMFISRFLLAERITPKKITGIGLIIMGAVFVSL